MITITSRAVKLSFLSPVAIFPVFTHEKKSGEGKVRKRRKEEDRGERRNPKKNRKIRRTRSAFSFDSLIRTEEITR